MMLYSIITICYNNLEGLKKTFASVQMQKFRDFEWIVIDGASEDGTAGFLKSVKSDNYTWISEKDEGIYDAMNKGIKLARGDYMVFLNSGDMLAEESTLEMISRNLNNDVKFVYGDSLDFDMHGNFLYRKSRSHTTLYKGLFTQHQSIYFARMDNESQFYYSIEYKLSADYDFIARYLKRFNKPGNILKINQPLSKFELGGLNESRRYKALKEDLLIRKRTMNINPLTNYILYLLHIVHTFLKRSSPGLMKKLRYIKP